MKVGALVRLSAYGVSRKRANWIERDDVGIVVEIRHHGGDFADEYFVKWCRSDYITKRQTTNYSERWRWEKPNHRKDLVYAK